MAIYLANPHMRATVASVVWSETDAQLVAALIGAVDKVALTALKAELEKNNASSLHLGGEIEVDLVGARRGYLTLGSSLERENAHGVALLLQHWRAGDPRRLAKPGSATASGADDYFYVVALHGENLPAKFLDRLQLALPWPLKPAWAETLLTLGRENGLVEPLSVANAAAARPVIDEQLGPDWESGGMVQGARGLIFRAGLRVRQSEQWGDLLSDALKAGTLSF